MHQGEIGSAIAASEAIDRGRGGGCSSSLYLANGSLLLAGYFR